MGKETNIQWAHASANAVIGCSAVSTGCRSCYAEVSTPARTLRAGGQETWGESGVRHVTKSFWKDVPAWDRKAPKEWNLKPGERGRVFANSLSDWLDEKWPVEVLARFLRTIFECPNLDFLLLTKRPENWRERVNTVNLTDHTPGHHGSDFRNWLRYWFDHSIAPENIWIGTSVENQKYADERIPLLVEIPAKVRFLSVEPLLGPVDLEFQACHPSVLNLGGGPPNRSGAISLVIVGGESGPKARPCNAEWILSIIRQCRAVSVKVFVKQLGSDPIFDPSSSCDEAFMSCRPLKDRKGGDMEEWPNDLRVREFPIPK